MSPEFKYGVCPLEAPWDQMVTWLLANQGYVGEGWDFEHHHFWFKNPEDATLFRLMFP